MGEQFKLFLSSLSFLSIIPGGTRQKLSNRELGKSTAYFPAVGLLIGGVGMILALGIDRILPVRATNALVVLYLAVVTGGLHLDALADTVDGFAGGKTPAARLRIMRDSAIGPFGIAAVTMALLLKYVFLNALVGTSRLIAVLSIPAIARWPMVFLAGLLPPVRDSGLGNVFAKETKAFDVVISGAMTALVCVYLAWRLGWLNLLLIPIVILITVKAAAVNRVLIGGVTGDSLGAMVEITEIALLLAITIIMRYA